MGVGCAPRVGGTCGCRPDTRSPGLTRAPPHRVANVGKRWQRRSTTCNPTTGLRNPTILLGEERRCQTSLPTRSPLPWMELYPPLEVGSILVIFVSSVVELCAVWRGRRGGSSVASSLSQVRILLAPSFPPLLSFARPRQVGPSSGSLSCHSPCRGGLPDPLSP